MMRGHEENRDPAARLDALWEATRPVEPSAEAWDRVWTAVADGLDRRTVTTVDRPAVIRREGVFVHRSASGHARRPTAVAAAMTLTVVLAQAAAILLAVGLSWRGADPQPVAPGNGQVATADVRIEEGQFVMIRSNADMVQAIDLSAQLGVGGVDSWYSLHNLMEATNSPVVAWSE
jgi:hypothetical protein